MIVAQSCLTLCNPMDYSLQAPLSMEFSRQDDRSGLQFLFPRCKESDCNAGDWGLIPGSVRSPGEGNGPTPVFLPGEFHG